MLEQVDVYYTGWGVLKIQYPSTCWQLRCRKF